MKLGIALLVAVGIAIIVFSSRTVVFLAGVFVYRVAYVVLLHTAHLLGF
jgi:hypothetical protein